MNYQLEHGKIESIFHSDRVDIEYIELWFLTEPILQMIKSNVVQIESIFITIKFVMET